MKSLLWIVAAPVLFFAPATESSASGAKTDSGKTQVIAVSGGREFTTADLRAEMSLLGLSPNQEGAARQALESLISRHALVKAAKKSKLHRKPEVMRLLAAAQERALAEYYLLAAARAPEPTFDEVTDFISDNPELFHERKKYVFKTLSMPVKDFEESDLTPLFDKTSDFSALSERLKSKNVAFKINEAENFSDEFPDAVRKQLSVYGVNDNIVLKGSEGIKILKITKVESASIPSAEAPKVARSMFMAKSSQERAAALLESLRMAEETKYFHASVAPIPAQDVGGR